MDAREQLHVTSTYPDARMCIANASFLSFSVYARDCMSAHMSTQRQKQDTVYVREAHNVFRIASLSYALVVTPNKIYCITRTHASTHALFLPLRPKIPSLCDVY